MGYVDELLWSFEHDRTAWIVSTVASVVLYAAVVAAIPVVLTRLPADYFVRPPRRHHPVVHALRHAVGLVVVAAGVAMLFLPGPGWLTILLGLTIMGGDVAARGARALIHQPRVLDAINGVRARRGRPPLLRPDDSR